MHVFLFPSSFFRGGGGGGGGSRALSVECKSQVVFFFLIVCQQYTCFGQLFQMDGSAAVIFNDAGVDTQTEREREGGREGERERLVNDQTGYNHRSTTASTATAFFFLPFFLFLLLHFAE